MLLYFFVFPQSRRVSFAEPISEHSPVKQFAMEMIATETDQSSKLQRVTHPPSPLVTTTPSKVVTVHSKVNQIDRVHDIWQVLIFKDIGKEKTQFLHKFVCFEMPN